MESPGGARPPAGRSSDSWFDRFLEDLEAGRIGEREEIAARFGSVSREDLSALEALWDAWRRGNRTADVAAGGTERYVERREIGRGGMGVVQEAWDTLLERPVAMKSLGRPGRGLTRQQVARFLNEARLTARLDHPGIVPVYDLASEREEGFFYTMRLVQGRTLREAFALSQSGAEGWNLSRAVNLLVQVCQITAFAHSRGVIHRDLKPSNVMVGSFGEVYLLDWGLARDLEGPVPDRTAVRLSGAEPSPEDLDSGKPGAADPNVPASAIGITLDGSVLGTPAFMAPEQARGNSRAAGVEADVYSLGAILYTLLTEEEPYAGKSGTLSRSEQVAHVITGPPRKVKELKPAAPAELVSICERAMARTPEGRYPGCLDLAEDLRAWLEGRVVRAHEAGLGAEARKWIQRNPAIASAIALIVVVAVAAAVLLLVLEGRRVRDLAAREELTRRHLYAARLRLAQDGLETALYGPARELLESLRPAAGENDLRCFGWRHLVRRLNPQVRSFQGLGGGALALQFIEPGFLVAGVARKGPLIAWDARTGEAVASWSPPVAIESVAIARRGKALILLLDNKAGQRATSLLVLSFEQGTSGAQWNEAASWSLDPPGAAVAITPDGRHAIAASTDLRIRLWDLSSPGREPLVSAELEGLDNQLVVSPDGRFLAYKSNRQMLRVFALPTLEEAGARPVAMVPAWLAFSPGSEAIAVPLRAGGVQVLSLREPSLTILQDLPGALPSSGVAFLGGAGRLVIGSDSVLEVWDAASGTRLRRLPGHADRLFQMVVSSDGRFIASSDTGGETFLWDLERPEEPQSRRITADHHVALWVDSRGAGLIALRSPAVLERFSLEAVRAGSRAAAPDGEIVLEGEPDSPFDIAADVSLAAMGGPAGKVRLLRLSWEDRPPSARELLTLKASSAARITALAFASGLPRLVAVGEDDRVTEWVERSPGSWPSRRMIQLPAGGPAIDRAAVSPEGGAVALLRGKEPRVLLADLDSGRLLGVCVGHSEWVLGISFSRDGRWLATASRDRTAALWEVPLRPREEAIAPARVFRGHANAVSAAIFLPDGQALATASDDATVKLWDLATGEERLTLRGHLHYVNALAATRDGSLLVSAGGKRSPAWAEILFWPAR